MIRSISFVLVIVLILGYVSSIASADDFRGDQDMPDQEARGPIRIDSNLGFNYTNGVSNGSGSQSDPWIIEGHQINGSGYGYCIYIGNTTDYFTIRNCALSEAYIESEDDPYYYNSGITLKNVANGLIEFNNVTDNAYYGIYLYDSDTNIIQNNIINSNGDGGIVLMTSDSNTIDNNEINDNQENEESGGIWLVESNGNTVTNNTIDTNKESGILIDYSTNTNIANNIITSNEYGIYLADSGYNTITSNNISENIIGILVEQSYWNDITYNDFADNDEYAIVIDDSYSHSNSIDHNSFYNNNDGDCQAYDSNGNNDWDEGVASSGNFWDDWYSGSYQIDGGASAVDNYPLSSPP